MATTTSLRRMLGMPDEDEVNVPPPGYLESVGVRKMDPAVVGAPRGYEPALPVPPSATPSGEDIPTSEDRVYYTLDPEGGRPSARALATLGGVPAAQAPAPRSGGPLAGRGKTAPIATPPTYESLAALAPGGDAEAAAQPSAGGDPTTVNGMVGKMVTGAGLKPAVGSATPNVLDAARRLLEARQASAGNRLIAGMAQAGATAIGKGDAPGLRQLAANTEVPVQEAEKDVARFERRTERDARTKAAVEAARRALGQTALGERRQAEMERHNRAMEARRGAKGGTGTGGGKILPASEAANVGGIDAAVGMLDQLMQTRGEKTGWASGVMQYVPGTDAAQYTDAQRAAAQTVGTILEGGKLTESDLARYMTLLPTAGDGEERARAKIENIKTLLAQKRAGVLGAMGGAGYNVSRLQAPAAQGTPASTPEPDAATATVRVRRKSDGKIRELAADAAKRVLTDPNYEAAP